MSRNKHKHILPMNYSGSDINGNPDGFNLKRFIENQQKKMADQQKKAESKHSYTNLLF